MLTILIILALLATIAALGLGLLSMGIGGSLDNDFGERFMWIRIGLQAATVILILGALFLSKT
ncbi:MAG: HIG1 domain-containing protein [Gammaproteobacteria bacterium]